MRGRSETSLWFQLLGLAGALAALGCGDDAPGTHDAGEVDGDVVVDTAEVADSGDDTTDGAIDSADTSEPDATDVDGATDVDDAEVGETDAEVDVGPRVCDDFEACDQPLDAAGVCPGTCRSTDDTLRCTGVVKYGVCHTLTPIDVPTEAVDFGDFTVTPIKWPVDAVVGQTYDLEVRLTNDTDAELVVYLGWKAPGTFSFADVSWENTDGFRLGVGASAALTARVTALQATTLGSGADIIVSLFFNLFPFEPRATVHFPDSEPNVCGGEHFPASYCPGEGCYESHGFYVSAKCCDDVFFPGALCCDDTDCNSGACVDGKCIYDTPFLASANNAALGHQRIRLVLIDSHPQFADPCADHFDDAKSEIDFPTVEAWYDDLAQRRIGRNAVNFKWIVTGGVATSDFLTGPNTWDEYSRELNAWLEARGCPIFDSYDKVIISSSTVDLMGFGGYYMDRGHIAVFSPYNAYLLAHELAHSYGATDLYLDLAGAFLYPLDLMGNFLSEPPLPGDKVTWGELGFADVDRNGVIDVVEMAAFPDELTVADATATITTKGTVELRWQFVGVEDGVPKRVVIPSYSMTVPAANAELEQGYYSGRWKVVTFDGTQVDLAALEAAGVIEVTLRASYRFTDRDWSTRTLSCDETLQIPITVAAPE